MPEIEVRPLECEIFPCCKLVKDNVDSVACCGCLWECCEAIGEAIPCSKQYCRPSDDVIFVYPCCFGKQEPVFPCCKRFDTAPFTNKNAKGGPCALPSKDLARANVILLDGRFETPEVKALLEAALNDVSRGDEAAFISNPGVDARASTAGSIQDAEQIGGGAPQRQVIERLGTEVSALERKAGSGASLLNRRIEVVGKGTGTVVGMEKHKGKPTKHVVVFDDSGTRDTLLLSKDGGEKGEKFYLLSSQSSHHD